jgi:outer membrane protein assembly factor BamB
MNVTTRGYDNARTMCNPTETVLTPQAVGTKGIEKIFALPFEGDARGCEAQMLWSGAVVFSDGRTHNIALHMTMANQVYCHDADTSQLLWERTYANAVQGSKAIDSYVINDHWGIISTGVVNETVLYFVTWGAPVAGDDDATATQAVYLLHEIDIRTGDEIAQALSLEGASFTAGGKTSTFLGVTRKQRCSLLLTDVGGKQTIFIGAGSLLESLSTNQGWVIAVDVDTFAVACAWTSTSTGSGAGIWMAGAGLAADAAGFVYFMTGNGDFDGETNWGESFVKLKYAPASAGAPATLSVVDNFTPWMDSQRNGMGDAMMAASPAMVEEMEEEEHLPSNARPLHRRAAKILADATMQGMGMMAWGDMDLGSGGLTIAEPLGLALGAGKDSVLYAVKLDAMGGTTKATAGTLANYEKLAFPPIFFGYYQPGNPAPANIADLNLLYGGVTHHQHGEMIYWHRPTLGDLVFNWSENGNLRCWSITSTSIKYLACSAEMASPDCVGTPGGGMPGGMISLSSNGENDGIVWACVPYGNANTEVTPGRLLAYDAQTFESFADGSKQLKVLWDSAAWNIRFSHNKFNRPVVANGKLYAPTYDGETLVFALA